MKVYLDLDGPILDIRQKCWKVHNKVVDEMGGKIFANSQYYWKQKQKSISKKVILKECAIDPELARKYLDRYIALIETEKYLSYDKIIEGTLDILEQMSKSHTLVLVTGRRNRITARKQIRKLDLDRYFSDLLISGSPNGGETADQAKRKKILEEAKESGKLGGLMVGDSEVEILAAKALNLPSVAVLGGIRSRSYFKRHEPNFMISHLSELPALIVSMEP